MPTNYKLLVLGREVAKRQPVDIGEQHGHHAHHVPDVRVQVVHQLTVGGAADLLENRLHIGKQLTEGLSSLSPLRLVNLGGNTRRENSTISYQIDSIDTSNSKTLSDLSAKISILVAIKQHAAGMSLQPVEFTQHVQGLGAGKSR